MFCSNCGTQLPDKANFCWMCGKPQKQRTEIEFNHETLEITRSLDYFVAKAIGPKGVYEAGRSQKFNQLLFDFSRGFTESNDDRPLTGDSAKVHNKLVADLIKDGWEATGDRSLQWWGLRFRRRLR